MKFSSTIHDTIGIVNYIHSDLWGLARVQSRGGARYFMSIIDDFSRKVWVHILKSKDQDLETFKSWRVLIENQIGRKIKKIRIDNGLEFCSNQFNQYYKNEGIARHTIVARTPQLNGLAKRMNRAIWERMRSMLASSSLTRVFWAKAMKTTCYFINRCPSAIIKFKTNQETWTGHPPNYSNLRVFGCTTYAHIR